MTQESHLIASVVHLHILSIDVDVLVSIVENCGRARVSRVASHVISHHQDDLTAGATKTNINAIHRHATNESRALNLLTKNILLNIKHDIIGQGGLFSYTWKTTKLNANIRHAKLMKMKKKIKASLAMQFSYFFGSSHSDLSITCQVFQAS